MIGVTAKVFDLFAFVQAFNVRGQGVILVVQVLRQSRTMIVEGVVLCLEGIYVIHEASFCAIQMNHLLLEAKVRLVVAQLHSRASGSMLDAMFGQLQFLAFLLVTGFKVGDLLKTFFGFFAGLKESLG